MADSRFVVQARFEGDSSGAVRAAKNLKSEVGGLDGALGKLGVSSQAVGRAFAALAAGGAALKFLTDAVRESAEAEEAQNKLTIATQRLGEEAEATLAALNAQAEALQKLSRFDDDAITGAQAILARFIEQRSALEAATKATVDFAAANGVDLARAAQLVGKTVGTTSNALAGYGITVEGAAGSSERLLSVTQAVSENFGGAAEKSIQTYNGAVDRLNNSYNNLLKSIGDFATQSDLVREVILNTAEAMDRIAASTKVQVVTTTEVAKAAKELGVSFEQARLTLFAYHQILVDTGPPTEALADSTNRVSLSLKEMSKFAAEAESATDRLAKKLNIQTSTQFLTEAFELRRDLILAQEEEIAGDTELIRLRDAAISQIEQLEENARRLAAGLPLIAPAAEHGLGTVTDAAAEATEQLDAARASSDSTRAGFAAMGAQAQSAAAQVAALAASTQALAAAQGGAAAVSGLSQSQVDSLRASGAITNSGRIGTPLTSGRVPILDSLGRRTGSRLVTPFGVGGVFGGSRSSSEVSSDGRIGGT